MKLAWKPRMMGGGGGKKEYKANSYFIWKFIRSDSQSAYISGHAAFIFFSQRLLIDMKQTNEIILRKVLYTRYQILN